MKEIDFPLYADKAQSRTFNFTNSDDSVYNFTGSTVVLKLYLDPVTPTDITGTLNISLGSVLFNFTTIHTDNIGSYEYIIEETKSDTSKVILTKGNITIKEYVPFSLSIEAFLESELPEGVTLTENFRNQKITYWRMFLMGAFNIAEANINTDSLWPTMVNALVAKLVAYDAFMQAIKGNIMSFFGGSSTTTSTSSGGVAKIVTGPAEVQFFPPGQTVEQILKSGTYGSSLDTLITDICGLASFLGVKVPMCKGKKVVISPKHYINEAWHIPTLDESLNSATVVSQGSIDEETTI